ncbi:MAG: DNA polymerase beta superfamily protein [Myxococcales bacterium]
MSTPRSFNLILPVGTQVVTRVEVQGADGRTLQPRGALGVVVQSPVDNLHAYDVEFPDGTRHRLKRGELTIRKQAQRAGLEREALPGDVDLQEFVILEVVVGSRAYGLEQEGSDTDRRGIYLPPAELHWSLWGVPEQLENDETQEVYWELQKFLVLALKANPNVLEVLYSPLVERASPVAQELLTMREVFLSKLVFQTFNGYVMSQFKKLEQDLRNQGAIKWKHAMHLVRLLVTGITILEERWVPVRVDAHRERLLAIRRGEVEWEEINRWRLELHGRFDAAYTKTTLPERPDYDRVNAFLLSARRAALSL